MHGPRQVKHDSELTYVNVRSETNRMAAHTVPTPRGCQRRDDVREHGAGGGEPEWERTHGEVKAP